MAAVSGKRIVYAKAFDGNVKDSDFRLEKIQVPAPKDGEVQLEAMYLTVDPYMRLMTPGIGETMIGEQVAKVIASKDKKLPVGTLVQAQTGWTTHSIAKGSDVTPVPKFISSDWPKSLALGLLGMPGITAYLAFLDCCRPKSGETVVVSGAAGAVGAVVGQIAKIKGCKVIGFAGSDKKVQYLKEIGYDVAINYKTMGDMDKALKEAAPKGIDCYFDNIGGEFSSTVMYNMNAYGRVCVCGSISAYNAKESPKARVLQPAIIFQRLSLQGFFIFDHKDEYMVAVKQLMAWLNEKKLIYKEHVTNGFENTPKAFQQLFTGENFGKAIIKI
ncbi:prostaglandin reductase 1-like isoform X1 [Lytechinus variegatus]|uniref:prostaglandin reductase 1-like n=1 Tax=Lytechinus variegatus TaxID=7654 RepID=UPI001BB2CDD3|nr:prostaglandin reductase 1-like [Lytechinus variegatus]XP_041472464.1 prostaglandin reductase 1-like isoform X1 [Lytechinus variegatus]